MNADAQKIIQAVNESDDFIKENYKGFRRLIIFLYWLAGVRKSVIPYLPETERERLAAIGCSVLVPTLMAFIGMYLYISSSFGSNGKFVIILVSIVWAFIIMNVDRLLLATYRPLQRWYRKFIQVLFRIGLAGFISVAIAFPLCLDLYEEAIIEHLKGEYRLQYEQNQNQTNTAMERYMTEDRVEAEKWELQLKELLKAGPEDARLYALKLFKNDEETKQIQQNEKIRAYENELEAAKKAFENASQNFRQAQQDAIDEFKGQLPPEKGGTGQPGNGPKFQELTRRQNDLEADMLLAEEKLNELKHSPVPQSSSWYNEITLDTIPENMLAPYLAEAESRQLEIYNLRNKQKQANLKYQAQRDEHMADINAAKQKYQEKINGKFDLMEKTVGLYRFIFGKNDNSRDQDTDGYKWMAGLFQFSTVFGTLFLLDLIAILSKVLSRPGPYDAVVEFIESVSYENIRAFNKEYGRYAEKWAVDPGNGIMPGKESTKTGIDLSNYPHMANFLLYSHLPADSDDKYKVRIIGKSYRDKKDEGQSEVD